LLAPIFLRRDRWEEDRFRILYLCSVLIFVVLFNHQAERASYLIAFLGATIWFAHEPSSTVKDVLYAVAFLTVPLMSTLIPGRVWRDPDVMLFRLAVPGLLIWLAIQWQLWKPAEMVLSRGAAEGPALPDEQILPLHYVQGQDDNVA